METNRNDNGQDRWISHGAPYFLGTLVLLIAPLFLDTYGQGLMTRFLIFALFAMSFNIVFGYAGLMSLGHAAFFGAGGYTVALLKLHYDVNLFWISAPLGILWPQSLLPCLASSRCERQGSIFSCDLCPGKDALQLGMER